uniref:Type I-A CRISPR-associated protein Csa5 n=1 Tax=Thermofilum adornatum TaxID=1365176 RepID=A0A7C1GC62_9CREN
MDKGTRTRNLARVLAILNVEQGSYTYIDKLSQAVSRDLALYYIREALRDYHSLVNRGFQSEEAKKTSEYVIFSELESEIELIRSIQDPVKLREELSMIAAQALAESGRLLYLEEKKATNSEKSGE